MKGVVFTEFLEMVEETHSADTVDDIIDACDLEHDGAYTAVGTYHHREILALVRALSDVSGASAAELMRAFGRRLFNRFHQLYPAFFEGIHDAFDFLETVEHHIHVEVLKLHPDAELPSFGFEKLDDERVVMTYTSARPFADLAEGLIAGCAAHFEQALDIRREPLPGGEGVRFLLARA